MTREAWSLIMMGLLAVTALGQSPAGAEKLAEAQELWESERYTEALIRYQEAIRIDPSLATADLLYSFTFIDPFSLESSLVGEAELARHHERSAALLEEWLEKHDPEESLLLRYEEALRKSNRLSRGLDFYQKLLKRRPDDPALLIGALRLSVLSGDESRIARDFDRLTGGNVPSEELWVPAAYLHDRAMQAHLPIEQRRMAVERAEVLVRSSLAREESEPSLLRQLGDILETRASLSGTVDAEKLMAESRLAKKRSAELWSMRLRLDNLRSWRVTLLQDGEEHAEFFLLNQQFHIRRAPFTIRVRISEQVDLYMNAHYSEEIIDRLSEGFDYTECEERPLFPCPGTTVAISPGAARLFPGPDKGNLVQPSLDEAGWSRISSDGEDQILELDVTALGDLPIEKTTIERLVLTLIITPEPRLDLFDVRFVTLHFQQ